MSNLVPTNATLTVEVDDSQRKQKMATLLRQMAALLDEPQTEYRSGTVIVVANDDGLDTRYKLKSDLVVISKF